MKLQHAVAIVALTLPLAAQSASGTTQFLVASEVAAGGSTQSFAHRLTGTLASGPLAKRATSTGYVLLGGFPAAIETPASGTPWLTHVAPAYAPLLGGTALTLHGTELNLGPVPQITIGGVAAVPGARTNATMQTTLPQQPVPGYQPVTVQNSYGSSTLPTGIGVLPLIDFPVAHQPNVPLGLRYLGAQGDQFVLALALGSNAAPLVLPPFHHGLQLDLFTLVVLPAIPVTDPSGELTIGLPAVAPPVPIWLQGFSLSQNPGWSPGSFTNVTRL
jgi:IPT/TIG domain-containing protein